MANMHKIRFPLGLHPRSRWRELTALPRDPVVVFNGRQGDRGGKDGGEERSREREEELGRERRRGA